MQFAGSHLLLSLFSFNVGIELGQLSVLALMLPALVLFRRFVAEGAGIPVLLGIAALVGSYWLVERWQVLNQTPWPRLDLDMYLAAARWVAVERRRSYEFPPDPPQSLFGRYFGPGPLIEDNSVNSTSTTLFNARGTYWLSKHARLRLDVFIILNRNVDDIT